MTCVLCNPRPLRLYGGAPAHMPPDLFLAAIGNVHGHAKLLQSALTTISHIPSPGKKRVLVMTGDLIHRGPDSLSVLRLAATAQDYGFDQRILLPGHHELLLLDALDALDVNRPQTRAVEEWLDAGGGELLEVVAPGWHRGSFSWPELGHRLSARLPALDGFAFRQAMRRAPSAVRFEHLLLVHAGIDPREPLDLALGRPQSAHRARTAGPYGLMDCDSHWAWVRAPFLEHTGGFFDEYGDPILIAHGHSPARGATTAWLDQPETALAPALDRGADLGRILLDGGIARKGGFLAGAVFADNLVRPLAVAPGG